MPNQVPYGFHRLADLKDRRISEVGISVVGNAVNQSFAEHTRNLNQMMSVFCRFTDNYKLVYRTAQNARLQPGDEDSRARKIKAYGRYEVGFPLKHFMIAWGANFVTRAKMTVGDVQETVATLMDADKRTLRDYIMIAIFDNAGFTFADPIYGNLPVKGLANGDSTVYNLLTGSDTGATDSHYLFAGAATNFTLAAFQAIYTELTEHPENGETVTVFVPSNQRATIEGLTGFLPIADANVRLGTGSNQLVRNDGLAGPGELFGYIGKCFVREWRQLPTDYSVAIAPGGEKPLALRQDPEAELQGFRRADDREDFPFYEDQYIRRIGIGAWNRVGALVYRTNSASYAVPTGFAQANLG
jgi:hypothetical protein